MYFHSNEMSLLLTSLGVCKLIKACAFYVIVRLQSVCVWLRIVHLCLSVFDDFTRVHVRMCNHIEKHLELPDWNLVCLQRITAD